MSLISASAVVVIKLLGFRLKEISALQNSAGSPLSQFQFLLERKRSRSFLLFFFPTPFQIGFATLEKKKKKLERDGRRDPAMRAHTHTDWAGVQPARCKYNREEDANTIDCIMQIQQCKCKIFQHTNTICCKEKYRCSKGDKSELCRVKRKAL